MAQNIILDQKQIQQITKRIAYQIYETFFEETEVVMFLRKRSVKNWH